MTRIYLIQAREEKELNQQELADLMKVDRKSVCRWERGSQEPLTSQKRTIRDILENDDKHLFDNIDIQGSSDLRGFRDFMELLRRQFIDALVKFGGTTLFGNVGLALVSSPVSTSEEYIAQFDVTLQACWEWLNQGNFSKVERALQVNRPTLSRLANTISDPYQPLAANLAAQAEIILALLAQNRLDYFGRETHCVKAVQFAQLSDNRALLAMAMAWQGMHYVKFIHQPGRAIPIFSTALSILGNDSSLVESTLCIDLSLAYSQDDTQEDYETKARDHIERAYIAMPLHPEFDPLYQFARMGVSELEQAHGKVLLNLAKHLPNSNYALLAHDAFNNAMSKESMHVRYRIQVLTRRADSLRVLGQMDGMVTSLEQGLALPNSKQTLSDIGDVLNNIPPKWKNETPVKKLQKDLTQALITARR